MNAARCAHPHDAEVLDPATLEHLRCHAHYCPVCRAWVRMSEDLPPLPADAYGR